jgi:hypothetical protein
MARVNPLAEQPIQTISSTVLPDEQLARKVNAFRPSFPPLEAPSLVGRVQLPDTIEDIESDIQAMKHEPNYLIKFIEITERLLKLFIKIHDKERLSKSEEKQKFKEASRKWGELQREIGDRGVNTTYLSLACMTLQFLLPKNDRIFVDYLAKEGCNNFSQMLNSETQSRQRLVDGISQIAQSELNAMINKGPSDANKQELIALLEKAMESVKRAAQSG